MFHLSADFFFFPGLKVLAQTFPEGMTTGTFPASCWASPPTSRRKKSAAPRPPPPPPQKPAAAETRCWFREDELVKIHEQLEKLLPYSNSSKTISRARFVHMCVCCRMFSPVFSCFMACDPHLSHQLDVQLSDFGEAQSSEDTLEIRCQSKPGWRHCLLHWLEWTPTGTRPYFVFFPFNIFIFIVIIPLNQLPFCGPKWKSAFQQTPPQEQIGSCSCLNCTTGYLFPGCSLNKLIMQRVVVDIAPPAGHIVTAPSPQTWWGNH